MFIIRNPLSYAIDDNDVTRTILLLYLSFAHDILGQSTHRFMHSLLFIWLVMTNAIYLLQVGRIHNLMILWVSSLCMHAQTSWLQSWCTFLTWTFATSWMGYIIVPLFKRGYLMWPINYGITMIGHGTSKSYGLILESESGKWQKGAYILYLISGQVDLKQCITMLKYQTPTLRVRRLQERFH